MFYILLYITKRNIYHLLLNRYLRARTYFCLLALFFDLLALFFDLLAL